MSQNYFPYFFALCSYPATWGGVVDNKPMAGGLKEFALRAMRVLKTSITRDYPLEVRLPALFIYLLLYITCALLYGWGICITCSSLFACALLIVHYPLPMNY